MHFGVLEYFTFFFFNDTATTEIYTLSLHDALPICHGERLSAIRPHRCRLLPAPDHRRSNPASRSEEHTSELQSRLHLVCRLLLEKKKKKYSNFLMSALIYCSSSIICMVFMIMYGR